MSIFFGFSDEYGKYQCEKTVEFNKTHPYYIRTTFLMNADEWKQLRDDFYALKSAFSLPIQQEIKWAYLWNLKYFKSRNEVIPDDKEFKFLESFDYLHLIKFVETVLSLLNGLSQKKIIISFTKNATCPRINEKSFLKMHLQEHMQRVEMEIQSKTLNNLVILFFDPVSEAMDKFFRDAYFDLYNSGDFISKYIHIKDSLNFEHSHQSVGIQIADYISGTFSSMLKGINTDNYKYGKDMYFDYIKPNLCQKFSIIWGYGLREVPSNKEYRKKLRDDFELERQRLKK